MLVFYFIIWVVDEEAVCLENDSLLFFVRVCLFFVVSNNEFLYVLLQIAKVDPELSVELDFIANDDICALIDLNHVCCAFKSITKLLATSFFAIVC